jgi:hypothetical protein
MCVDDGGDTNLEIFNFMGDLYIQHFDNVFDAIEWYLKSVKAKEELNTDYIIEMLDIPLHKMDIIYFLRAYHFIIDKTIENIFDFLQLAQILFSMKQYSTSI